MREILFRAKRIDNGEWVEGCLEITHVQPLHKRPYDLYEIRNITVKNNHSTCMKGFCVEVDPSTVGQFTGLTDKNGKRIFEGDILIDNPDNMILTKYEMAWIDNLTGFLLDDGLTVFNTIDYLENFNSDKLLLEVIGNIHDNPELLEVSNNE